MLFFSRRYRVDTIGNNFLFEDRLETEPTSTNDGWTTEIVAGNFFTLVSIAECFDNPPLSTLAAAAVSPIQQQPEDSPILPQSIGDSPKLTAPEKITKLKQQWL